MKIRKAAIKDARNVSLLIHGTLDKVNSKDYSKKQLKVLKAKNSVAETKRKIKEGVMFLAFVGKRLVGSVALRDEKIWGLYVKPSYMGKGIGNKLMKYIENYARNKGIKTVEIYSTVTAKKFYRKIGYKNTEGFMAKMNGVPMKMFWLEKELK